MATYFWYDGFPKSRVHSVHECVDWDAFNSWAESRKIIVSDLAVLEGYATAAAPPPKATGRP
jgi:hypothetical protein